MAADARIAVKLVYALPDVQALITLEVAEGTTVADAIALSGLNACHGIDPGLAQAGIYGRRVAPETVLKDGDRIEIYRGLVVDPKKRDGGRRREAADLARGLATAAVSYLQLAEIAC